MAEHPKAQGWRAAIAKRLRFLVVLSGMLAVAGQLGNLHWVLELFSHFIAWYALGSIVLALLLAGFRSHGWALGAALLGAAQAIAPLSWYLPPGTPAPAGEPNLRVLLANVHSQNLETGSFLALVSETKPDIVCVQEVTSKWRDALAPLEESYPVHLAVPREDNFGIAIYSRLPGPAPELIVRETRNIPAIALRFRVGEGEVRLLNIHAVPPMGRALAQRRAGQLAFVRAWLDDENGPAIVIGDLNLTQYSPAYSQLVGGSGAYNARAGFGPRGTWPAWVPILRLPIDQCLVRSMHVLSCRVLRPIGSDHLPLEVSLHVGP